MNDPIGDMLTRIRNSQMRGKSTVMTPGSKLRAWRYCAIILAVRQIEHLGVSPWPVVTSA